MTREQALLAKRSIDDRRAAIEREERELREQRWAVDAEERELHRLCPHETMWKIQGSLGGHRWLTCKDCGATLKTGPDAFEGKPDERRSTGN